MSQLHKALIGLFGLFMIGCQSDNSSGLASTASHAHTSGHSHAQASGAGRPAAVATLEKAVLSVHDSLMTQMSELRRLDKAVTKQLTELDQQPASTKTAQRKEQGQALKRALAESDKAMMAWMHDYNGDTLGTLSLAKGVAYLTDQHQKVNALQQSLRKTTAAAETYLK